MLALDEEIILADFFVVLFFKDLKDSKLILGSPTYFRINVKSVMDCFVEGHWLSIAEY